MTPPARTLAPESWGRQTRCQLSQLTMQGLSQSSGTNIWGLWTFSWIQDVVTSHAEGISQSSEKRSSAEEQPPHNKKEYKENAHTCTLTKFCLKTWVKKNCQWCDTWQTTLFQRTKTCSVTPAHCTHTHTHTHTPAPPMSTRSSEQIFYWGQTSSLRQTQISRFIPPNNRSSSRPSTSLCQGKIKVSQLGSGARTMDYCSRLCRSSCPALPPSFLDQRRKHAIPPTSLHLPPAKLLSDVTREIGVDATAANTFSCSLREVLWCSLLKGENSISTFFWNRGILCVKARHESICYYFWTFLLFFISYCGV